MMPPAPTHLYDIADRVLSAVEAAFDAADISLPDRRYITGGEIVWDCPDGQLVVQVPRIYVGLPAASDPREIRCGTVRSAGLTVWLLRCVPTLAENGEPPPPGDLDDSGRDLLIDAWTLSSGIISAYNSDDLVEADSQVFLADLAAVGPQGGLGGWRQDLRVQVGL